MGTVFRLIMQLLGHEIRLPAHLSSVSKTIEMLPVPKNRRWFWGGLLHFLPVLMGLFFIFVGRKDQIQHGAWEKSALILASLWAWLGPCAIWHYERYTLPRFHMKCRRLMKTQRGRVELKTGVYSNIFDFGYCKIISAVWIILVMFGFVRSNEFVRDFGLSGIGDWLWWALFLGVLFFSYYTSLGFCFAYKTMYLTRLVNLSDTQNRIYHRDGVFGFSFIGEFALRTDVMFFSGWLMAPLVFFIGQQGYIARYTVPGILLGLYFFYMVAVFVYPIYIVHTKIVREKGKTSKRYCRIMNECVDELEKSSPTVSYYKFSLYRKILRDLHGVSEWPLKFDVLVKFSLSAIVFPLLVGIGVAVWSEYGAAP